MEKKLPPNLSDFGSAILVNAIYRHTQKIMAKDRIALHSWAPSAVAQRLVSNDSAHAQPVWLSTNPNTIKWRNSACDSLDVLHWSANSKAARLSGLEHHLILQLHLARLITLTPTEKIQRLATAKISLHPSSDDPENSKAFFARYHQILEWAIRDRCKARLSIIHCGAIFWHIRRYSRSSILEPYAIYLATLVLWAFCTSMQLPEVINAVAQDCDDDPEPRFLHLDRPIDDELVQTFVRAGHKMSAHMSRVGNVLDKGAPIKILKEGIALLANTVRIADPSDPSTGTWQASAVHESNYTWGIEYSYLSSLQDLVLASVDYNGSVDPRQCLDQFCDA
jgi:predicted membrane protein